MRRARWLAGWRKSEDKPTFYHVISRVVERRLAFGVAEKEKFRALMRMQENFTGCRVASYCLMCNHFHLLLEVPPMPQGGFSDAELLTRLSAIYNEAFVAEVATELANARAAIYLDDLGLESAVAAIHQRFTYRMHDLGEFMKGLLQRFTQWFNHTQARTGRLWEDRFKSLIVESGSAARAITAYIDLNPVRAGMVTDPADYRWSSYGEAIGGGLIGNGKKARAGLVRAYSADQGTGYEPGKWPEVARPYRCLMGFALTENPTAETPLPDLHLAKMLRCRVRYFTDGAVIGSRGFVNEAFDSARERFGPRRKDGARKLRGNASAAAGTLWSLRALQKGIS